MAATSPFPFVERVPSPCYVCDTGKLAANLAALDEVQRRTGAKIILAFKGFAMWSLFPQIRAVLPGASASSLDEARLAAEEFGGEVHVYCPAYREEDFAEMLGYADHLVFNSFSQWQQYQGQVAAHQRQISCGIRVNPEYSEVEVDLYNPCGRYSRLGVTREHFRPELLAGPEQLAPAIEGLHFHALCEQNADALAGTLAAFNEKFGRFVQGMKWLNFGGGHHITRADYDRELLCRLIDETQQRYGVQVYLEPGEAIALNIGVLVARVLDIVENEISIAILDTSAATHMPDVLEMPYRPHIFGAGEPGQYPHTYRLGGLSCLAGDIIGDYSFPEPLTPGQRLVFGDMAHYTMVKNTTFNGVRLPSIATYDPATDNLKVIRRFGYEDYRNRLS
ncbi:carboxynorspermidine decarboxylase [Desulfurivibrio alkaliphilus]|uniref:Carboxynorspermidine/carboxyspermidine decarboxylase n=1 Tax=Desulfurivibrio alkaliphilus (strain DSM 19089 / UNIQEM U267 / AHT2) TaxID=589865 RepID=D6Z5U4_DESAT|nr:carboxynorspermidine decarboxylase [Desulfurivibrio alkaliphilus]ADH84826.1 carboxynorspermidine decarboxylase [Desulfurivibrio alkaliphilus AHT 2]